MAKKQAHIYQVQGTTFAARADSKHWVIIDNAEKFGGNDSGPRAKELLLFSLAGCTSADIISILRKKRVPLKHYEIHLTATETRKHPRVFSGIHLDYVFFGDGIKPKDVERAIELSTTKYCGVSAMLAPKVKLTHSYRIEKYKTSYEEQE